MWRTTAMLAAAMAAAALVTGCGDGLGAKPPGPAATSPGATAPGSTPGGPAQPTPPDGAGDAPSSAPRTPDPTPSEDCSDVGGLPGCVTFTSVSGSDPSGPLPWLGTDPVSFSVRTVNGRVTVGIGTPCNGGGGPAELDGATLTVDHSQFAQTLIACLGPQADYERWTWNLIAEPVSYAYDGTTLTWSNPRGTVVFRR
ncbi:META domain-containing protein [Sinomonas mesophila]|uniref:META domain-containing protein n=1 Tax=Sinomonas mesophila TaxID=1531955 RepID=UPI001589819F|nr:META domain-containing protein [Sinomonas mesophila]